MPAEQGLGLDDQQRLVPSLHTAGKQHEHRVNQQLPAVSPVLSGPGPKHSKPSWLAPALLDDVLRRPIELAANASDAVRDGLAAQLDEPAPVDLDSAFQRTYRQTPPPKLERPPRNRLADDFYREVAFAYRWAVAAGRPPLEALAAESGIPRGTIARWVATARDKGFLA